jgi:superfamily II DNA/RNA helicase
MEQQIFAVTNQSIELEVRPTRQLEMEAIDEIEQLYESRAETRELLGGLQVHREGPADTTLPPMIIATPGRLVVVISICPVESKLD